MLYICFIKTNNMKELKELADHLEKLAKQEKDLGVKSGLMQAACLAYTYYNELTREILKNQK